MLQLSVFRATVISCSNVEDFYIYMFFIHEPKRFLYLLISSCDNYFMMKRMDIDREDLQKEKKRRIWP